MELKDDGVGGSSISSGGDLPLSHPSGDAQRLAGPRYLSLTPDMPPNPNLLPSSLDSVGFIFFLNSDTSFVVGKPDPPRQHGS